MQSVENFENFPALSAFRRNLRSISAVTSGHGIELVILSQAHRYDEVRSYAELPNDTMRLVVTMGGGVPPDLPTIARGMAAFNGENLQHPAGFDLCSRVGKAPELFVDGCHLSAEGSRAVAETLIDHLEVTLQRRLAAEKDSEYNRNETSLARDPRSADLGAE